MCEFKAPGRGKARRTHSISAQAPSDTDQVFIWRSKNASEFWVWVSPPLITQIKVTVPRWDLCGHWNHRWVADLKPVTWRVLRALVLCFPCGKFWSITGKEKTVLRKTCLRPWAITGMIWFHGGGILEQNISSSTFWVKPSLHFPPPRLFCWTSPSGVTQDLKATERQYRPNGCRAEHLLLKAVGLHQVRHSQHRPTQGDTT